MKLLITGGERKTHIERYPRWAPHEKAKLAVVDVDTGHAAVVLAYETPADARPDKDWSIVFKSGSLIGNKLYVCTQTEVLVYDVEKNFEQIGYISLPMFNDLHHVKPATNGNLLVVCTGLDSLIEVTDAGEFVSIRNVLGRDIWDLFSPNVDYRRVPNTKPHQAHPNYVFETGDQQVWVTRFEQRDAICMTDPSRRIAIDVQRPHDGVVRGDEVIFTTVDGHVVIADWPTQQIKRVVNLNLITTHGKVLGWCRGLAFLDTDRIIVGFSRIRATKYRKAINWAGNRIGHTRLLGRMPTRIAAYDLNHNQILWEIGLEMIDVDVIFSVLVIDE